MQLFSCLFDKIWKMTSYKHFRDICMILNITYKILQRYVSHRYLPSYTYVSIVRLINESARCDVLIIIYHSHLPGQNKCDYYPSLMEKYILCQATQTSKLDISWCTTQAIQKFRWNEKKLQKYLFSVLGSFWCNSKDWNWTNINSFVNMH